MGNQQYIYMRTILIIFPCLHGLKLMLIAFTPDEEFLLKWWTTTYVPLQFVKMRHIICPTALNEILGGRRSPAVACWASDHWVASSNPLRGKFRFIIPGVCLAQISPSNVHKKRHKTPSFHLNEILVKWIYLRRLFSPVQTFPNSDPPKAFLKLRFENKGLDAIRLSNILDHKSVCSTIPPYFKKTTRT